MIPVNFFTLFFDVYKKKTSFCFAQNKISNFGKGISENDVLKKNICRADIGGPRYAGREHGDVDARHQEPHPVWREGGEKRSVQAPRGTTSRGTYLDKKTWLISQRSVWDLVLGLLM